MKPSTWSYEEYAEFLYATGAIYDILDKLYAPGITPDYDRLVEGIEDIAADNKVTLLAREEWSSEDFFDDIYQSLAE